MSNQNLLFFDKEKGLTIDKCIKYHFVIKSNDIVNCEKMNSTSTTSVPKENISQLAPLSMPSLLVILSTTTVSPVVLPSNKKVENIIKKSYVQTSKANILLNVEDVLYIKEAFPSLLANKVGKIIRVKNNSEGMKKPRINMTTREPFRKRVIVLIDKSNAELIVNSAHIHIANINKCLKNTKSDIIVDFICCTDNGAIITINKSVNTFNLSIIKKYLKNINNVNSDLINSPCLPKSKSYLKIIRLLHKMEQGLITPESIESILKETHLFKDIVLALKLHIIKVSPKSNKTVVQINIWDSQSGSAAKNIINQ